MWFSLELTSTCKGNYHIYNNKKYYEEQNWSHTSLKSQSPNTPKYLTVFPHRCIHSSLSKNIQREEGNKSSQRDSYWNITTVVVVVVVSTSEKYV